MKVLVTGGAGFWGRGLLRRVVRDLDWEVTVYSRDETRQEESRKKYPHARYVLGDVRDLDLLTAAMMGHDWVVHAGAVKYIPEAELNATECVNVNVGGAENIVRAARTARIKKVVGISTDKAVQPVNVYGCTKMLMERLFADSARFEGQPSFCCVRYGNVIGSTGSVIPLFKSQLADYGKVRITNPEMTRFWMSVDEAIDLVELALTRANPGSVVVPPARAMSILDVAKAATQDDVEVELIGERPGEKLHEMLIHYEESVRVVLHQNPFYYELLPPGNRVGEKPFTLASHTPNSFMSVETMRDLIADAQEV